MINDKTKLQARLKNCLLTIIEMEPMISRLSFHHELEKEFKQLREISGKISGLDLSDAEVQRIENATETFLKELEIPGELIPRESQKTLQ